MTIKQKNKILLGSFICLLILCYQLAIKQTLQFKAKYKSLEKEALILKNVPQKLATLNKKNSYYDSILTQFQLEGSSIQNNLLKSINTFAVTHNLTVVHFLEPHLATGTDSYVVKIYEFTIEGNYNSINQLVYNLEQQSKYGEIISLNFEKKKNYKSGHYYLQAQILLKSF
tara:strand:+ start:2404 stop:2916 length:513 start_codon:yes stop_codon:yes gene_type:complete